MRGIEIIDCQMPSAHLRTLAAHLSMFDEYDRLKEQERKRAERIARRFSVRLIFRLGSAWVGAHWSSHYRRLCVNPLPFVTLAFTWKGGTLP